MPLRTRSAAAVASYSASCPLLSVPYGVLSDFALVRLPARSLGCAAMACVKLRQCASDPTLQLAHSLGLEPRDGETTGSLLFAIRVLQPHFLPGDEEQGGGEVLTFGRGDSGQLVHGGTGSELVPRTVEALAGKRVVQVAAGGSHTAVLTSDGEMLTFGRGGSGQLGHGGTGDELVPRTVQALAGKRVVQIVAAAGDRGSTFINGRLRLGAR